MASPCASDVASRCLSSASAAFCLPRDSAAPSGIITSSSHWIVASMASRSESFRRRDVSASYASAASPVRVVEAIGPEVVATLRAKSDARPRGVRRRGEVETTTRRRADDAMDCI